MLEDDEFAEIDDETQLTPTQKEFLKKLSKKRILEECSFLDLLTELARRFETLGHQVEQVEAAEGGLVVAPVNPTRVYQSRSELEE